MQRCWLLILAASGLYGQTIEGPVFEAASLKKLPPGAPLYSVRGGPGTPTPTRVEMHMWISMLAPTAFDRLPSEFVNLDKLPQDVYEFEAVLPVGATKDDYRAMLRNLLIERFHLRYHPETRELKHYELRAAPGGPKMKPASGPAAGDFSAAGKPTIEDGYITCPPGVNSGFIGNGPRVSVQRIDSTVAEFAEQLKNSGWFTAAVDDKTGLTGRYDFRLRFTAAPNQESETSEPDLATAMREQLGLILREVKSPAEVIVIDSIDREPTPN